MKDCRASSLSSLPPSELAVYRKCLLELLAGQCRVIYSSLDCDRRRQRRSFWKNTRTTHLSLHSLEFPSFSGPRENSIRFIYGPKSSSPNLTSCDQQPDMRCPLLGPRVQFLVKRRHHPVSEGGGLGAGNVRRVFRGSVGLATTVKI